MLKVKVQVNEEDSSLYFNYKDLRSLFLEIILIMAGKYKRISLKVGLAVTVFILDSLAKTAEEEELEEINVSRNMVKKYINKAIRKNKKKVDKKLELILDQELEEITTHEINVVSTGIENSTDISEILRTGNENYSLIFEILKVVNESNTKTNSLLDSTEALLLKLQKMSKHQSQVEYVDTEEGSTDEQETVDTDNEAIEFIYQDADGNPIDGPNENQQSADEELPPGEKPKKRGRPPKQKN